MIVFSDSDINSSSDDDKKESKKLNRKRKKHKGKLEKKSKRTVSLSDTSCNISEGKLPESIWIESKTADFIGLTGSEALIMRTCQDEKPLIMAILCF